MKNITIIIGLLVIILVGGFIVMQQIQKPTSPLPQNSTQTNTESVQEFISTTPDNTELKSGGSSFRELSGIYTFLYPAEFELHTQDGDPHTRISKKGATQMGQTEMYDGILIDFESINLEGKSLEEFVDSRIIEYTNNGISEVVDAKRATKLNNYPGFTYELSGLGSTRYLVIQKDIQSDSAVSVSFLVADPENKGYQKEVDTILSTLELLK
jgi:hypothetical protein